MIASIAVPPEHDLKLIAHNAGVTDFSKLLYDNGMLYIEDCSQEALDKAHAEYSHADIERARQLASVAAVRYEYETAGVMLNGFKIDTSRDSQGLILGAAVQVILDPEYSLNWKTPEGWLLFSGAQITAIATRVRKHVQACFDRERVLADAINNGTFDESMLYQGWPEKPPVA